MSKLFYVLQITKSDIRLQVKTLLFGDTNIDNVDNITIILAVHDYIKNSERF